MELETLTPRAHRTVHLGAPEERHKVWGERHEPAIESVATAGLHRTEARKGWRAQECPSVMMTMWELVGPVYLGGGLSLSLSLSRSRNA